MNDQKKRRLESAGFRVGTADEFLKLTPEESALVNLRLPLGGGGAPHHGLAGKLSQVGLPRRIGSSQSRVAKLEAAESEVSLDLLFRAFFATGGQVDTGLHFRSVACLGSPKRALAILDKVDAAFARPK